MKKIILIVALMMVFSPAQNTIKNSEEVVLIRKILNAQGVVDKMHQLFYERLKKMVDSNPEIDKAMLDQVYNIIEKNEIEEKFVQQWVGEYSIKELNAILSFFQSEVGKVYFEKNRIVEQKTVQAGSQLGLALYNKLNKLFPSQFPALPGLEGANK